MGPLYLELRALIVGAGCPFHAANIAVVYHYAKRHHPSCPWLATDETRKMSRVNKGPDGRPASGGSRL
jgi:hypothetical protein